VAVLARNPKSRIGPKRSARGVWQIPEPLLQIESQPISSGSAVQFGYKPCRHRTLDRVSARDRTGIGRSLRIPILLRQTLSGAKPRILDPSGRPPHYEAREAYFEGLNRLRAHLYACLSQVRHIAGKERAPAEQNTQSWRLCVVRGQRGTTCEVRNKYAHGSGSSAEANALKAITLLHVVVEGTVSLFGQLGPSAEVQ